MISVCINTRNRKEQLVKCVERLLNSTYLKYEIIIVDQSDNPHIHNNFKINPQIRYFIDKGRGTGRAKNIALQKASGDLVAFTDDDCLVEKNWLNRIYAVFREHPDVAGLFGRVLAFQSEKHKGFYCPCTVNWTSRKFIKQPCKHWECLGYGNNMTFRKSELEKVNGFRNWLGPGSVGRNADDAEIALRLLVNNNKLMYDPSVKVWHNRWLTKEELERQNFSYICGETSCYGYFAFQGYDFAMQVIKNNINDSIKELAKIIKSVVMLRLNEQFLSSVSVAVKNIYYRIRGLIIAFWFSLTDPIQLQK